MRWLIIIFGVVLAIALAAWQGLPLLVSHLLQQQASAAKMGELLIGDVDFNPLRCSLRFEDFVLASGSDRHISGRYMEVDLDCAALLLGRINIEGAVADQSEFWLRETDQDGWYLLPPAVLEPAVADAEQSTIEYTLASLLATDARIKLRGQRLQGEFVAKRLELERISNWRQLAATELSLDGAWNNAPVSVRFEAKLLADGQPEFSAEVDLVDLQLADFAELLALDMAGLVSGDFEIAGTLSHSPLTGSPQDLTTNLWVDGDIKLEAATLKHPAVRLQLASGDWSGRWQLDTAQGIETVSSTTVSLKGIDMVDKHDDIELSLADIAWEGDIRSTGGASAAIDFTGQLTAGELKVRQISRALRLLEWQQFASKGFTWETSRVLRLDEMRFNDLALMSADDDHHRLHTGELLLSHVNYDPAVNLLQVSEVRVVDSESRLVFEEEGFKSVSNVSQLLQWFADNYGDAAQSEEPDPDPDPGPVPAPETEAVAAPELRVVVGAVEVTDSHLELQDTTLVQPFERKLDVTRFTLSGLDTGAPDAWVPVTLAIAFSEYSSLSLNGRLQPFKALPSFKGELNIDELPMLDFSAYVEDATGYEVLRGQLDLLADIDLADDFLNAELDAVLRKFRVKATDREDIDSDLGMPLNTALNMIRDGNDNITLDKMKIAGNLNEPDVALDQLVVKATSKALLQGSMTYFTLALQPYGAAFMAAEFIGKQAGKVRLDPMQMVPQSTTIAPEQEDYLPRLVKLLAGRPKLHLVICGEASRVSDVEVAVATEVEPEPAQEGDAAIPGDAELLELAKSRAAAVKKTLVAQGVDSERLLGCKAAVTDAEDGSRVVLAVD